MRHIKDVGSVHENTTLAEEALIRHELSVHLQPYPRYSDRGTEWGWSARVQRNAGSDHWGYADGFDTARVILDAVRDYESKIPKPKDS